MHLKVFCIELMYGYWVLECHTETEVPAACVVKPGYCFFFLACNEMGMGKNIIKYIKYIFQMPNQVYIKYCNLCIILMQLK